MIPEGVPLSLSLYRTPPPSSLLRCDRVTLHQSTFVAIRRNGQAEAYVIRCVKIRIWVFVLLPRLDRFKRESQHLVREKGTV